MSVEKPQTPGKKQKNPHTGFFLTVSFYIGHIGFCSIRNNAL